jgi:hypothetical protein
MYKGPVFILIYIKRGLRDWRVLGNLGSAAWPQGGAVTRKPKPVRSSRADRAAEQADYKTWKQHAAAELEQRHDTKAGIIPERIWRRLYIQHRSPQDAADQAAVSAYHARSAADRLRGRQR